MNRIFCYFSIMIITLVFSSHESKSQSSISTIKRALDVCEISQWNIYEQEAIILLESSIRELYASQSNYDDINESFLVENKLLTDNCTGKSPHLTVRPDITANGLSAFRITVSGLNRSSCRTFINSPVTRAMSDNFLEIDLNGDRVDFNKENKCLGSIIDNIPFYKYLKSGINVISFLGQ